MAISCSNELPKTSEIRASTCIINERTTDGERTGQGSKRYAAFKKVGPGAVAAYKMKVIKAV